MSTGTKRTLSQAIADAEAFRDLFPPTTYQRWEIAGSVRRGRADVGDVEHVVIPKFGEVDAGGGLFAMPERKNLLWYHLETLLAGQFVVKHVYGTSESGAPSHRWGEKYRGVDFRGFAHEIFCADAANWGSVLAIRTGPGGYSRMLVTRLQWHGYMNHGGYVWNKRGWSCACGWRGDVPNRVKGELGGGWTTDPDGRDGGPFTDVCPACADHKRLTPTQVPVPEEAIFFRLCGLPYVAPAARVDPVK